MPQPAVIKDVSIPRFDTSDISADKVPNRRRSRRRWLMSLLASIVAAAATGIAGMGFAATIFFRHDADGSSSLVSPILIAVAFAALIFGAHCLDRIDAVDHAARVSKLKEKLHIDSL